MRRIASDHMDAGLAPVDVAVMDFAEKVARDASSIVADDIDRLRRAGPDRRGDPRCGSGRGGPVLFSTTLHAMGVRPDSATLLGLEAPLRAALTGSA